MSTRTIRRMMPLARAGGDGRRGSATVELALVIPLLAFLLFAIIEFGLVVKVRGDVGEATREGARLAAVGGTLSRIDAGVASATSTLAQDRLTRTCRFRSWDANANAWTSWQTLQDSESENSAGSGDQVEVEVTYHHHLLLPGMMGPVLNADDQGNVTVTSATVMMRE